MADKVTLEQVREFIRHADADTIRLMYDILSSKYKHLQAEVASSFTPGEPVYFIKGKRSPRRIMGEVVYTDKGIVYIKEDGRLAGHGGWNWKVTSTLVKRQVKR